MEVIPTIRTAPTRVSYETYINSPEWRRRRDRKLRSVYWRCEHCNSKRELQVHHRSYDHLGDEWDCELQVLCANCHRHEHLSRPDQTSLGVYLKLASETVSANPWGTIADLSETIKRRCIELTVDLVPARIHSALAVVCGRLKSRPGTPSSSRIDELQPENEFGPVTKEEARDFFYRLDTVVDGGLSEFIQARTMPVVGKTPDQQRQHEENLRQQIQDVKRITPKISTMNRLQVIFGDRDAEAI